MMRNWIRSVLASSVHGRRVLTWIRFCRKLPALWRQELCLAEHDIHGWSDNRIFVYDDQAFYPIYCPDDLSERGHYLRTYNVFCHQANAWYMRREVRNFIRYAAKASRFADVGSAEGFYSALFASMHGRRAEILSIDCGSTTGCNPNHSLVVQEQNRKIFQPSRWDYLQAYVTDRQLQPPDFPLPAETQIATLSELFQRSDFVPDLIKFDIESSEYEVLLDSLGYLQGNRPTLIIEVHNEFLFARGLSFGPVLARLRSIGYQVVACDDRDYLHAANCHVIMQCFS
jgi:hypothetical protein